MATVQNIIDDFQLFMDDSSEMSTAEEIRIIEKHSQRLANQRPWLLLRKEGTGTVASQSLALPTRFSQILENYNYTENGNYGTGPVVLLDDTPWKVISYEDRKRRVGASGYCYVDIAGDTLEFTGTDANGKTASFDYIEYPATLTATTDTIWIPDRFAPALYHSVCADDYVIQQSEKAMSYRDENIANAQMWLREMVNWDFRLRQLS